jgi:hypothetical protein
MGGGGRPGGTHQREGMGILEYQAMSSLRDVAHDVYGCVHLLYNSGWKFHQLAAGQLLSGHPVHYGRAGGMAFLSRTKSHLLGHSPPCSQPGRPPCWDSPLAFGLIVTHCLPQG